MIFTFLYDLRLEKVNKNFDLKTKHCVYFCGKNSNFYYNLWYREEAASQTSVSRVNLHTLRDEACQKYFTVESLLLSHSSFSDFGTVRE